MLILYMIIVTMSTISVEIAVQQVSGPDRQPRDRDRVAHRDAAWIPLHALLPSRLVGETAGPLHLGGASVLEFAGRSVDEVGTLDPAQGDGLLGQDALGRRHHI